MRLQYGPKSQDQSQRQNQHLTNYSLNKTRSYDWYFPTSPIPVVKEEGE